MNRDPALHTGNYASTMEFLAARGIPDIQAGKLLVTARSGGYGYVIYRRMKIAYRTKAAVNRRYRITQDGSPEPGGAR